MISLAAEDTSGGKYVSVYITALPSKGSLYHMLENGSRGQKIVSVFSHYVQLTPFYQYGTSVTNVSSFWVSYLIGCFIFILYFYAVFMLFLFYFSFICFFITIVQCFLILYFQYHFPFSFSFLGYRIGLQPLAGFRCAELLCLWRLLFFLVRDSRF